MDHPGTRSSRVFATLGKLLLLVTTLAGLVLVVNGEGWVAGTVALAALLVLAAVVRDIGHAPEAAAAYRRSHGE